MVYAHAGVLVAVVRVHRGALLNAGKSRVEVERIGVKLGEMRVLRPCLKGTNSGDNQYDEAL